MIGARFRTSPTSQSQANMSRHHLIKVVKRFEREQSGRGAAEVTRPELTAHEKAREQEAAVKAWISEYRQARLAQSQELKHQLGG